MQDERVVVTGAAGAFGTAIADCFHHRGWKVIGVDRKPAPTGGTFDSFVQANLTDPADFSRFLHEVPYPIGALVNNAAIQINSGIAALSDADWSLTIDANLLVPARLIRDLRDQLIDGHGAVVNISSVHALATSENIASYAVSKAALVQLTRSAALELAPSGIRVNAVAPGAMRTPMLVDGLSRRPHPDGPDGNMRALSERTPLGFVATPDQVAPAVAMLADNVQSAYTTGQVLVVDGGATLRLGTE